MDQHSYIKETEVISRTIGSCIFHNNNTGANSTTYNAHTTRNTRTEFCLLDTWMGNVTERQSMAAIYILPVRTTSKW